MSIEELQERSTAMTEGAIQAERGRLNRRLGMLWALGSPEETEADRCDAELRLDIINTEIRRRLA